MSYLRFEDHADGVHVIFTDATFTDQWIATLDRSVSHTFKFETTFVKGDANDVVRVFIDGDAEDVAARRGRTTTASMRSGTRPRPIA